MAVFIIKHDYYYEIKRRIDFPVFGTEKKKIGEAKNKNAGGKIEIE